MLRSQPVSYWFPPVLCLTRSSLCRMRSESSDEPVWARVGDSIKIPLKNAEDITNATFDCFPGLPNGLRIDKDGTILGVANKVRRCECEKKKRKKYGVHVIPSDTIVTQIILSCTCPIVNKHYIAFILIRVVYVYRRPHRCGNIP